MKMTIKDFIVNNMTDGNFEKLVNYFISNAVHRSNSNLELLEKMENDLEELSIQSPDKTFEVLNQIKEMSSYYIANYKERFLPQGLADLNDTECTWKMEVADPNTELELEIGNFDFTLASGGLQDIKYLFECYPELKNGQGNFFFDEIKFPYRFYKSDESELLLDKIESHDIDENNYLSYIEQEKNALVLGLANFLYEVIHYNAKTSYSKPQFEEYATENSYVKIVKDGSPFAYSVQFLVDNRMQYLSEEVQAAYLNRFDAKLELKSPKFVEFEALYEDLSLWDLKRDYILEPFTCYLNEEITVPELSEEAAYTLLEELVTILTLQGFTKSEQITELQAENEGYEEQVKYIYML